MEQKLKKIAILAGGGPAPGINSVIAVGDHPRLALRHRGARASRTASAGIMEGKHRPGPAPHHRGSEPHPPPRRLLPGHGAREPDQEAGDARHHGAAPCCGWASTASSRSAATTPPTPPTTWHKHSKGSLHVVHVPKTIDNDLHLPLQGNTFGFQTARHVGAGHRARSHDRREDDLALVLRGGHGPQGRTPRARHRQGGGRDAHHHPRGVRQGKVPLKHDRRHRRWARC